MKASGTVPVTEEEFTKIQELLFELLISEVMTSPVVTVFPDQPMSWAKETMRLRRFSGLPVVSEGRMVGIVSIEDVVRWLEQGTVDGPIRAWMTETVHCVSRDEPAIAAITKFGQTRVGRLPVVDDDGRLVGIITPGDVSGRLLRLLDRRYREEETTQARVGAGLQEFLPTGAVLELRYPVARGDFERAGSAATGIKRVLSRLRVDPAIVRRAGIVAYEAEMNLAIHADCGGVLSAEVLVDRLLVIASDDGPGIADIEQAMSEGFSTAPEWIRALGFGAGMGLSNMKRCADRFSLDSNAGRGTTVRIELDVPPSRGVG